ITDYLQKFIPKDSVTLDLGAGYCDFINNISSKEKHALDAYSDLDKYAEPNVNKHKKDCSDLGDFQDNYFDIIFASNIFEHLNNEDITKTLTECRRIMKENGKLIIIQPNFKYAYREYFDDFTHQNIFTHISLSNLLKTYNFKINKIMPKFLPMTMKSRLPKFKWLIKVYLHSPFKPLAKQMLIIASK
ncbi:class I SAM-dependent methyltransferase, partial [bacterium]|nr:class I SAM-dependent methyltransferase [bacterium]